MRLVLVGSPVGHSLSPTIHRAALAAAGIDGTYDALEVDEDGLAAVIDRIRGGDLDGANVTMPHKQAAARLADRLDSRATRAGAVNTLYRRDTTVWGATTDVDGVRGAFRHGGLDQSGPVLVLGSGGAAAAALLALEGRALRVATRRPETARMLLARLSVVAEPAEFGRPWEGATVVNATPIGMHGEALPAGVVEASVGLLDMAYGVQATPAVRAARAAGRPVADGLDMLVAQAAASFALWTGRPGLENVMRRAIRPV